MGIWTLKTRETSCPAPLEVLTSYLLEITYIRAKSGSLFTILDANFKLNPKIDDKDVNVIEYFLDK